MKSTQGRLKKVYCRPTRNEWETIVSILRKTSKYLWRSFDNDGYCYLNIDTVYFAKGVTNDFDERVEIPVARFIDLIDDRIVFWRLEEDGFEYESWAGGEFYWLGNVGNKGISIHVDALFNDVTVHEDINEIPFEGVRTYTQLLNLIEMIG